MAAALSPEAAAGMVAVSRETLERLRAYVDLLRKWRARINLVGASTLADPWRRHILDSAQLHPLLPDGARVVVDLGSGAGFPGLVLAAMGVPEVHLIEADARKCAFMREAARIMGVPATIHNRRIEAVTPFAADAVTARALAPLAVLLGHAEPFLGGGGQCLFLKGRGGEDELTEAAKDWTMAAETIRSLSDPLGNILRIGEVKRGRAAR